MSLDKYGLSFDHSTTKYKVIRIFIRDWSLKNPFWAEIHTLGSETWREINKAPPYPNQRWSVFAKGALHWKIDSCLHFNKI